MKNIISNKRKRDKTFNDEDLLINNKKWKMPNKKIDMDGNNYCPIKGNNKSIIPENKEYFDKKSNNINYNISNQDNKASMKIPKKVDSDKSNFNNSINEVFLINKNLYE